VADRIHKGLAESVQGGSKAHVVVQPGLNPPSLGVPPGTAATTAGGQV